MKVTNKALKQRILEISHKYHLSHIGSCLTAVDIIQEIYAIKKPDEKFVLSSGHAGLALYVVLEKYTGKSAEDIWKHHGTHPDRCSSCAIDCSTGSLGNGLPISLGMALSDRSKNVYCLISDGECSEGSIWESLRIAREQKLTNLKVYVNYNHWGAYKKIDDLNDMDYLVRHYSDWRTGDFLGVMKLTNAEQLPFLKGLDAHYHVMTDDEYKEAMEILK